MPQVNRNTVPRRQPDPRPQDALHPVLRLSLAVNHRIKKGDEWVDDLCFVDVVVFGKSAEYMSENADKGHSILVHGRLQFRSWEDLNGNKRSKHEIVADRVFHLGKSSGGEGRSSDRSAEREPGMDDEVPL